MPNENEKTQPNASEIAASEEKTLDNQEQPLENDPLEKAKNLLTELEKIKEDGKKYKQYQHKEKTLEKPEWLKEFKDLQNNYKHLLGELKRIEKEIKELLSKILEKSPYEKIFEALQIKNLGNDLGFPLTKESENKIITEIQKEKITQKKEITQEEIIQKVKELNKIVKQILEIEQTLKNLKDAKGENYEINNLDKLNKSILELEKFFKSIKNIFKNQRKKLEEIIITKGLEYSKEKEKEYYEKYKKEKSYLMEKIKTIEDNPIFKNGLKYEEEQKRLEKEKLMKEILSSIQSLEATHKYCYEEIFKLIQKDGKFGQDLPTFKEILLKEFNRQKNKGKEKYKLEKYKPSKKIEEPKENLFVKIRELLIKAIENGEIQSSKKIMPWKREGYHKKLTFLLVKEISSLLQSEATKNPDTKELEKQYHLALKENKIFGLIFGPKYTDKDKKMLSLLWELLSKLDMPAKNLIIKKFKKAK
jgi:hypothetical protein